MTRMTHYILQGTEPLPIQDVLAWAQWFETSERRIARTPVTETITVSTVFLGLDHQWGEGPPLLFETMVFGQEERHHPALEEFVERYSTYQDAEQGHEAMCDRVRTWLADGCRGASRGGAEGLWPRPRRD